MRGTKDKQRAETPLVPGCFVHADKIKKFVPSGQGKQVLLMWRAEIGAHFYQTAKPGAQAPLNKTVSAGECKPQQENLRKKTGQGTA